MDFIRGLFSVAILYAVGWGIYQLGFMSGAESEMNTRLAATKMYENCHHVLAGVGNGK